MRSTSRGFHLVSEEPARTDSSRLVFPFTNSAVIRSTLLEYEFRFPVEKEEGWLPATAVSASTMVDLPPLLGPTRMVRPPPGAPVGTASSMSCPVLEPRRDSILSVR